MTPKTYPFPTAGKPLHFEEPFYATEFSAPLHAGKGYTGEDFQDDAVAAVITATLSKSIAKALGDIAP